MLGGYVKMLRAGAMTESGGSKNEVSVGVTVWR